MTFAASSMDPSSLTFLPKFILRGEKTTADNGISVDQMRFVAFSRSSTLRDEATTTPLPTISLENH